MATSKIGAPSFLLTAMIVSESLHTGDVLDRAGDAERDIDARMDGLAGLADLVIGREPARVGHGAGSAHNAAEQAGEFFGQRNALFRGRR